MSFQDFLHKNELMFINQQLDLYKKKVRDLEKRQRALRSTMGYRGIPEPFNTMLENFRSALVLPQPRTRAIELAPVKEAPAPSTSAASSLLAQLSKDNLVGVLGEVNVWLKTLSDVINQAESYVHSITSVLDLLERSGLDLKKYLFSVADEVKVQMASPVTDSTGGLPEYDAPPAEALPEYDADSNALLRLISDVAQSPLFQQLVERFSSK